jgi:glutathione reductase (NADPH)
MKFDLIIIGAGMAGVTIANKCAKSGLKTAITDSRPYGGTCALRGCDPKKILVGVSEIIDRAQKMEGKGVAGNISIDWKELMAYKNAFVSKMPSGVEKGFEKSGVSMFHGSAKFLSANSIQIGDEILEADKFVVSTGARPRSLDIPGEELAIDSTAFLDLEQLPKKITFIGGGYIAMEFAHLAARSGSEVTIIHRGPTPLENFEQDLVKHLVKASEELGISFHLSSEVNGIEKKGDNYTVSYKTRDEKAILETDLVVNSAGRVPELDDLNLASAGISYGKKGIEVNEFLQSKSQSNLYAAGDSAASPGLNLTPIAVMEGHAVAANIIRGNTKIPNYTEMPSAVFTLPTLASVGKTESEVKDSGEEYKVKTALVPNWYNAKRVNEKTYAFKIISNDKGQILGAHILGPHAEETINLFAMAIKAKLSAGDIRNLVYSYPSMASDVGSMV